MSELNGSTQRFWSMRTEDLLSSVGSSGEDGLSSTDASSRIDSYGYNELKEQESVSKLLVIANQLRSPLLSILVFAAIVSGFAKEWTDSIIILTILSGSVAIGYSREYRAQAAAEKLRSRLVTKVLVLRDKVETRVDLREIVPGDIVLLSAGNLIPADARLLESKDFFVNEAVLTGESFPVEKKTAILPEATPLSQRSNCVFLGASVRSGTARCVVVSTGTRTEFGSIAHRLTLRPPETDFDRGIRRFGYLLMRSMFLITIFVFTANLFLERPLVETLLFSVALAVGLSPELLPAILNVNLARGAQSMATRGVLVRRLNAIENLGSMNVLCTDKTGTLTEGVVRLTGAYNWRGEKSDEVLSLALSNAHFQSGLSNPLDEAILTGHDSSFEAQVKLGEVPYDFVRKRMSVIVSTGADAPKIITKGAFEGILDTCTTTGSNETLDSAKRDQICGIYDGWTSQGVRVLAVAAKTVDRKQSYAKRDEKELSFVGLLTFQDEPKEGAAEAISELKKLGVAIKLISGDSANVTKHVASKVGIGANRVLTGGEINALSEEALRRSAIDTDIFAEVDPNQKERIILSLKKTGHVVGFLGDGINDAPAMHAADTSLSVEQAADVAREAADFVLLEKNLHVIRSGIEEGRKTFTNSLKYILMASSANLGNMISMATASIFLPFLPMLAGQVLLNNFLADLAAMGLADDNVDPELVAKPRRWDMGFIGRFMVEFGLLSSLFDFLTFAALLLYFSATVAEFRTGWFVESLLTQLAIALVIRTQRPFFRSRPGKLLLGATLLIGPLAFVIPFLPFSKLMGFTPIPFSLILVIVAIVGLYVLATELTKLFFYRRFR